MQRSIGPSTQLFLFNFETIELMGPFVSSGDPALNIEPDAWGGQVRA